MERLINILSEAGLKKCYISIHGMMSLEHNFVSPVFFDIDMENDVEKAREIALKIGERIYHTYRVRPYIRLSGSKGHRVLVPIYPVKCESQVEANEFLKICSIG